MLVDDPAPVRPAAPAVPSDHLTEMPPARAPHRVTRVLPFVMILVTVVALLFGVPAWTLLGFGTGWPGWVTTIGGTVFLTAAVGTPALLYLGFLGRDWAARIGSTLLGVAWVLFSWSLIGNVLRGALWLTGVGEPLRSRTVAAAVASVSLALLIWGFFEAMRVPRVTHTEVRLPRLGAGLDGTRVVVLTDTHYGPINRARWSARVVETINALDADLVCHTGDIADGTVDQRRDQVSPLAATRARLGKVYVTGNHEYMTRAQGWLDHLAGLGWQPLHNRHIVVERGGDRLVVAGVDDVTAAHSREPGHAADYAAALREADPQLPVLLLAHQPKQVAQAVRHGVDLQVSGHTHGGQIWPFEYLVRLDQPVVRGLSDHGERTRLYTSGGAGFWGPPFRIFAPSEIAVLTLRAGENGDSQAEATATTARRR